MAETRNQPVTGPTRRAVLAGMAGAATATALAPAAAAAASASVTAVAATAPASVETTAPPAGCANPPVMPSAFLDASRTLTGIPLGASYLDLAQRVWAILVPTYGEAELERLVGVINDSGALPLKEVLEAAGLMAPAQALATTWYTGANAAGAQADVAFYNDALVWRACSFTKPPATCGGPFGYWQNPA